MKRGDIKCEHGIAIDDAGTVCGCYRDERDRYRAALEAIARGAEGMGCGDSGCIVEKRGGMSTNGGCRCHEDGRKARYAVGKLRQMAKDALEGKL